MKNNFEIKNILVTGANGFIGKALISSLNDIGFKVFKFDSLDGDICEYDFINKFQNIKIDYIFHLASKTFIPDSWADPIGFYKTSVIGTNNILEFCREKSIPLTYISAYLYGIPKKIPISENEPLNPNNPYAHSKYLAEELCKFYSDFYNVKVTIVRPFNIYGKNQKKIFLIPYIIEQVLNAESIIVENLKPERDYIYLTDFINGLIKTIKNNQKFSIYNFGSGKKYSVKEIIDIIQKVAKTNKKVISKKIERKNEIISVIANIEKANRELNWKPLITFEQGIIEILEEIYANKEYTNK